MRICFIGGGNMATALIGGMLNQGMQPAMISVVEPDADKRSELNQQYGVTTLVPGADLAKPDVIVLAVKPQQLKAVAESLASQVGQAIVISIAAGIRLSALSAWLGGYRKLVRVMPNTPALVQAGISGAFADPSIRHDEQQAADRILRAVGSVVWLTQEEQIDGITAVSGSGPAYVFYFIEALEAAALAQGFEPAVARELAYQTFHGAIKLAMASDVDAATLRARVTSKGGTTEQGIASFESSGIRDAVARGVQAAADRSRSLAEELGRG